jgi:hypothetical protein
LVRCATLLLLPLGFVDSIIIDLFLLSVIIIITSPFSMSEFVAVVTPTIHVELQVELLLQQQ